nr:DegV family protein [Corynebacterium lactis]
MAGDGIVRIVVDDTACLVPTVAERLDITVVPVGHDVSEDEETTSAVSPLRLCAAYARALERSSSEAGDAGVVAIHMSKGLSATWANAVTATGVLDGVTVIDSETVGAGLGAAAIAAAKAARAGACRDEVAAVAQDVLERYRLWLYVPKLEPLRKGGRISAGQAMISTALAIKPIVGIKEGGLGLVAKCRTEAKVKQRLVEFATQVVEHSTNVSRPTHVLLHHADAIDDVEELQAMLAEALPEGTRFKILRLPDSLIAHTGVGAYAVGIISGGSPGATDVDFHRELGAHVLHSLADGAQDANADSAGAEAPQTPQTPRTQQLEHTHQAPAAEDAQRSAGQRTQVTDEQGIPLFTTVASKLPTWSENRRMAMEKADRLAKAIADLRRRDKSDPEGASFGQGEEDIDS